MGEKVWGVAVGAFIIDGVSNVPSTVPCELS